MKLLAVAFHTASICFLFLSGFMFYVRYITNPDLVFNWMWGAGVVAIACNTYLSLASSGDECYACRKRRESPFIDDVG